MTKRPATVSEYIASAPKEVQAKLRQLRAIIRKAAPGALEKISYGMPYYGYHGRLAYFRYNKQHIGLYLTPPLLSMFQKELKAYSTSKATLRFPLSKPLPTTLISRLVKARLKLNLEQA